MVGKEIKVLDKGFVRVIDVMGNDAAIVQAARVSYGEGTKTIHEDEGLIRYLMRHRHTTPFEMCEIKLHIKVPMDTWRQWIRHRTANVNEYSTRYSVAIDDKQITEPNQWRIQSKLNKQGSEEFADEILGQELSEQEFELHRLINEVYQHRLNNGIAREQARKDLPLSNYTEAYWKIDLKNLLNFLSLRMDSHAQYEIRQYANAIAEIVKEWLPLTWAAFEDYWLNGLNLSSRDIEMIKKIKGTSYYDGHERAMFEYDLTQENPFGWFSTHEDGTLKNNRERKEFEEKAQILGISIPW